MAIDIDLMGEMRIGTYTERAFKSAWYGLLEVWGNYVQTQQQVVWKAEKWNELKLIMVENFGSAEAPKVSTEQLIIFALKYFDKDLNALLEVNRESFKKRQKFAQKAAA
jgi:hypothetical protein